MASEKIIPITIEDEMQSSYIDYSMSVIVSRALPDVRDGLKPVHRRILYGMSDLGMLHNRNYKRVPVLWVKFSVSITLTATLPCMTPLFEWFRSFRCAIRWWTARELWLC